MLGFSLIFAVLLSAPPARAVDHAHMHHAHAQPAMPMRGMLGGYGMMREGSGTSWTPESTPFRGRMLHSGDWMMMSMGAANLNYVHADGPRGGKKLFSSSHLMGMAQRPLAGGTLGLRAMGSLDPAMGKTGYPLLLQTGETADGRRLLVDRQHPHDLIMELAASYSRAAPGGSAFAYFGLPGEPALGPTAFMHRASGMDNPQAPIGHHWLDSTHITYGVATVGYIWGGVKLEGSTFRGREPDRWRWDIEPPRFDSYSARLSWNPTPDWSAQVSYGRLVEPEELEAGVDTRRTTASISWNARPFGRFMQTTFAWGRNEQIPGHEDSDAFLLEAAVRPRDALTVFARAERVDKNELFEDGHPQHGGVYTVHALSLGTVYEFARVPYAALGAGAVASIYPLPAGLRDDYNRAPTSLMVFLRARLN